MELKYKKKSYTATQCNPCQLFLRLIQTGAQKLGLKCIKCQMSTSNSEEGLVDLIGPAFYSIDPKKLDIV